MTNVLTINGHKIIKTKISETDFRISVARAQKFIFSFVMTSDEEGKNYTIKEDLKKAERTNYIIADWIQPFMDKIFTWAKTDEIPEEAEEGKMM